MGSNEDLTVGEFERAMAVRDKWLADRFSAVEGRLSAIAADAREIRRTSGDHQTRLTVIETKGERATKRSWGAVVTAIVLALAEAARQFYKP